MYRRSDILFRLEGGGVHIVCGVSDSRLLRHLGDCDGVIAGYYFDIHALFREIPEGSRRFFPDGVGQKDQAVRRHGLLQFLSVGHAVISAEYQHAVAFPAVGFDQFLMCFIVGTQDEFRGADDIGDAVKGSAAVFVGGRKGGDGVCCSSGIIFKIIFHGGHGDVVSGHGIDEITQELFQ